MAIFYCLLFNILCNHPIKKKKQSFSLQITNIWIHVPSSNKYKKVTKIALADNLFFKLTYKIKGFLLFFSFVFLLLPANVHRDYLFSLVVFYCHLVDWIITVPHEGTVGANTAFMFLRKSGTHLVTMEIKSYGCTEITDLMCNLHPFSNINITWRLQSQNCDSANLKTRSGFDIPWLHC